MKLFAVALAGALCLSAAARVYLPRSLNINTSQRQVAPAFQSFTEFNRRSPSRSPRNPIDSNCLANPYRTLSGTCNNRRNINWGAIDTPFRFIATPVVHDITKLPNARTVSNEVCAEAGPVPNRRGMSELVTFFGQFLDHTVTETGVESTRPWDIKIPAGDPAFPAGGILPFTRTARITKLGRTGPRNLLSSYIDGNSIYSAHAKAAKELRTLSNGLLKTSAGNLLPRPGRFFLAGDPRANENPLLTSFHTVFVREHNRVAAEVKKAFPGADDEELYQRTRKVVIAELQAIVYYEFVPAVIGRPMPAYRGYDEAQEAAVSNTFSTVGFRVGHTLINPKVTSISASGVKKTRMLRNAFFNPEAFVEDGMDNLFRGMMRTTASEIDNGITEEVRDFLIASEGQRPQLQLDLAALNIQRGRDHGVPSYNALRTFYGLRRLKGFNEITKKVPLQIRLEKAYGLDINKVDPWVGGISEDQAVGSLGPLFARIWVREFMRLRSGDRFYFENSQFSPAEIAGIPTVKGLVGDKSLIGKVMQHILKKNTGIPDVPANPFFV